MEDFDIICRLAADNADLADFLVVYIAEAHATDGWAFPMNKYQISNHSSIEDRLTAAAILAPHLAADMTLVADSMSDNAQLAYGAFPERLYIVQNGVVEYHGNQGPFGFYPADVDTWLKRYRDGLPVKNDRNFVKGEVLCRDGVKGDASKDR